MELRPLRYFVTVAELGNVSRAAEKLFIAQPPLSTQIKQLEDEIGMALLVRGSRGVSLTPAGVHFLAEAKDLLERAERLRRLSQRAEAGLGEHLVPKATAGCVVAHASHAGGRRQGRL